MCRYPWRQEGGISFPGAEIASSCEPSDLVAENRTLMLSGILQLLIYGQMQYLAPPCSCLIHYHCTGYLR